MPYWISSDQADCDGWATLLEKDDGTYEMLACHETKEDAVAHMVAASINTDGKAMGQLNSLRAKPNELVVGDFVSWDSSGGRAKGKVKTITKTGTVKVPDTDFELNASADDPVALITVFDKIEGGYEMSDVVVGHKFSTLTKIDELAEPSETRAVNLAPPAYMRAAAKRGVKLHEEGFSGSGVRPQTVEDARKMAAGTVTAEKWRKIGPWIARHLVDLDAVQGDEITPGLVAHLLWGSGPSKSDARRAMEYANDVVGRLDEEREAMNDNEQNMWHDKDERVLPDNYRPANSDDVPEGASCGTCMHRSDEGMCMRFDAMCDVDYYCNAYEAKSTDEIETEADMEESDDTASIRNRWVVTTNNKRSIAYSNLEVRAEGAGNTLVGYAAVFDSPSEPLPWTEFVRRGAFAKTINDGADVRLLVDHEGVPLARTKSGTLRIKEDDKGLRVEADLDEANPDAARVMSALRRGDVSQMSFAFEPVKDSWSKDNKTRELKEVKLFDVSVVTYPAYEETMVQLRNAQANNTNTTIVKSSSLALRRAQIAIQRTSRAVQQPTE